MIDTKLLRQKLIDMALRGQLVEQRPEDGNATDLLEQIRAEKAALIKAGKIKKEKPLPEIKEEEKPFAIPANWCWVRLGEICKLITKGTTPRGGNDAYVENGVGFLRAENVCGLDKLSLKNLKFIDKNTHITDLRRSILECNDILVTIAGTLGRTGMVRNEDLPLNANQAISIVRLIHTKYIELKYVVFLLNGSLTQSYFDSSKKTTAIPNLTLEIIGNVLVPLPPLAEQKRIVNALEACLKLVDTIAKDSADLDKALKFLRQKMLDMAVRGQLVEQRPEDGNATDLLEQIRAEKAALIKAGKIKKEKPLPEIKEEDKPFAIPANWCWVRLGEIGSWCAGSTPPRNYPDYYKGNIPWLKTGDLNDNFIEKVPEFVSDLALQDCSLRLNPVGSVLIAMYGATIGKLGILRVPMTTNQACCACVPFDGLFNLYLFYFLMANKARFVSQGAGGAQPNISKEKIIRFPMPLPPLAEQKRIVAKLEQINALIETMLN